MAAGAMAAVCSQCPCSCTSSSQSSSAILASRQLSSASAAVGAAPKAGRVHGSGSVPSSSSLCSSSFVSGLSSQILHHRLHSVAPSSSPFTGTGAQRRTRLPCPRAGMDSDTIVAVGAGFLGIALGIGVPVFYETQLKGSTERENDQPCFPCKGTGSQQCRFCIGAGEITVELGAGEREVSKCINCEGNGTITCTTCQGSGVQPRYLDRREFKDDD